MKKNALSFLLVVACAVLLFSLQACNTADKNTNREWKGFVPSPEFSPPYTPLPHHFNDSHNIQILCRAPKGAVQRALAQPLEQNGDGDLFVLQMGWSPDCEGFNVHEIQINAPVKWKDSIGSTTLIEYIDSDMGLIAGREIWGWPKKMADIVWTETDNGWTVECYKQKDQGGIPLMKVEYTISDSTPDVEWPVMRPTYLVKRIPNASPSVPPLTQLVCVGCSTPPGDAPGQSPGPESFQSPGKSPHSPALQSPGCPVEVLDAKMGITKGPMVGGLDLGEVVYQWEE